MSDVPIPDTAFNPILTGRLGVAIGITAIGSLVTLGLLYAGIPIFGPINDLTTALLGALSAALVWQLHVLLRARAPGWSTALMLVAWVGSAAIIVNSILVAAGRLHWMTGGMYTALGLGLQGIWLFGLLRLIGPQPFLTPGLIRLASIAAILMWLGLLAGPLLAAGTSLTQNPLVWVAYVGAAGGWLLFPLWCWLVGRQLVSL